jgi:restriction system protein
MAIPDFQTLMLPLLKAATDGQEHSFAEVIEKLAAQFQLTDEERNEMLPSGLQARFDNRVGWARTDLRMAGLVEGSGRGKFKITARGLKVLKDPPERIDRRFLRRFPEYENYVTRNRQNNKQESKEEELEEEVKQTPEEILESSYQSLRRKLAEELLERIKQNSPRFFERLVVDLLVAMGYGGSRKDAGEAVGRSGDEGIDGIIKEDKLGLDAVYIQAKRWQNTVGSPDVQAFAGALMGKKANKGVFITTSQFSKDAQTYVSTISQKIVLIDGEQLAQLIIDHGVGVTEVATYVVKRVDSDYFSEE